MAQLNTIETYIKDYKIFIDTCSLLEQSSIKFWNSVIPYLQSYNTNIIVPYKCYEEIKDKVKNAVEISLRERAKIVEQDIIQLYKSNIVNIIGDENDTFADNLFLTQFTRLRLSYQLILITQDNKLAKDILRLNRNQSVRANEILVKRINEEGQLEDFKWHQEKSKVKTEEMFKVHTSVTTLEDKPISISSFPKEQEVVYTSKGPIRLLNEIASGGEGIIYETDTPFVAKIYKKENNTIRKHEKIKRLLSKQLTCEGICLPVSEIYNSNKEFVGYLMPKAKGKELQKSIFIKPLFLKNFPDWKKRDTVELCITILKKIKYLHDRNIIIGDINPANILVVSSKEVYFVDTDSYQIEDLPCPVGTINYTAPEIQRKRFSEFLRTRGNENFAVATLLFMIMLPGKTPYAQQGGEDPITNIIKMDFSYPFRNNSNKKTPDGPWRFMWSHLTFDVKETFYHTFRKDGKYSTESTRLSVDEWLPKFKEYLYLLDSGKFGEQDKMSEELFPDRYKKSSKLTYVICKLCNKEVPNYQSEKGYCKECLDKGEIYHCKKCGEEMIYTNRQRYLRNSKKHTICDDCYEYGNSVWGTRWCVDCGSEFDITHNELAFYQNKGWDLPKRCEDCRGRNNQYIYNNEDYENVVGVVSGVSSTIAKIMSNFLKF